MTGEQSDAVLALIADLRRGLDQQAEVIQQLRAENADLHRRLDLATGNGKADDQDLARAMG